MGMVWDDYKNGLFYEVVEEEYARVRKHPCDDAEATKDKKRIRSKFRHVGASMDVADGGRGSDASDVMEQFIESALERFDSTGQPWVVSMDWARLFAVFAEHAWPRLGAPWLLQQIAEEVVDKWHESCGRPCRYFGEAAGIEQAAEGRQSPPLDCIPSSPSLWLGPLRHHGIAEGTPPVVAVDDIRWKSPTQPPSPRKPPPPPTPPPRYSCEARNREVPVFIDFLPPGERLGICLDGLRVESIRPNSVAERFLAVGDVLATISGRRVQSEREFLALLETARPGPVRLTVARKVKCMSCGPQVAALAAAEGNAAGAEDGASRREWARYAEPPATGPPAAGRGKLQKPATPARAQLVAPPPWAPGIFEKLRPALKQMRAEVWDRDAEHLVVLNCEDIGAFAACSPSLWGRGFPWKAVERAVSYFEALGYDTWPVIGSITAMRHPPPRDLEAKLVRIPAIDADPGGGIPRARTPQRVSVLRMAEEYQCWWVDNANYRASSWEGHASWEWLQISGMDRKVEYLFDTFGNFVPLRNVTAPLPSRE
mmetsp:Transcript_50617/g.147174  ORF Transcript_50617/g.147174 Transcript_50617/m.147174 type:complete len:540 (-) Transcript_50617:28-1647(-)